LWCLKSAKLSIADVECVAYYENPQRKLESRTRLPHNVIRNVIGFEGTIETFEHHMSHAASACYFSGFSEAAVVTIDSVGEWASTTYSRATRGELSAFEEVRFPNSLGLLYSAIMRYLGFDVNDGEYKVMGLEPYGRPRLASAIREMVQLRPDGQFELRADCFDFTSTDRTYSDVFEQLLGCPPRGAQRSGCRRGRRMDASSAPRLWCTPRRCIHHGRDVRRQRALRQSYRLSLRAARQSGQCHSLSRLDRRRRGGRSRLQIHRSRTASNCVRPSTAWRRSFPV
jgi:hypothetical protein